LNCYAFRDALRNCEETMDRHIMGVVKCLEERWEFEFLVKKVSRLLRTEEQLVRDLTYIAAVLHDFGKMKKEFQERCRQGECKSFPKHYITSARFAMNVAFKSKTLALNTLKEKVYDLLTKPTKPNKGYDLGDVYILSVVIPVLLHNYAHLQEESLLKTEHEKSITVDECCREVYLGILEHMEKNCTTTSTGEELLKAIRLSLNDLKVELSVLPLLDPGVLLNYILNTEKMIVEALTGLLNICDGRVAYMNRRCLV